MNRPDRLLVVYDGECGACTGFAEWAVRHDRAGRLTIRPNQTPGLIGVCGLTRSDVDESAWVIDGSGRRLSGAAAVNRVWHELGGPWRVLARASSVPFVLSLEEAVYRWVAPRRRYLRGLLNGSR